MNRLNSKVISLLIVVVALLLFVPFLGGSHLFDWDEINFAEAAREMLLTGDFSYVQINFKPFWEKPPLFVWMQALSMTMFGINEFAARVPNAICGAFTLMVLFNIGNRISGKNFGLLWVLVYAGSMLSQFYFRSGIIDPWFNLFIFLGVHQLTVATESKEISMKNVLLSAVFIGLSILTKGPTSLALVSVMCAVYFFGSYKTHQWKILPAFSFTVTVLLVGFSWYIIEVVRGHGYVIQEFIDYHIRLLTHGEAGHAQPFYYHFIVLLVGCFPMSLFLVFHYFNKTTSENQKLVHYLKWMNIMFWVTLIVFSVVKTKIIHYSSLTYFPMSFIATYAIHKLLKGDWIIKTWQHMALLVFSTVLGSAFFLLGILNHINEPLLHLTSHNIFMHSFLDQNISDGKIDGFIGIFFLFGTSISVFLLSTNRIATGIIGLFGTTLITVSCLSIFIAPKIDRYTQESLFELYKENANTTYLQPIGYHSYAHLFYGKRMPPSESHEDELAWMIKGDVDKPVLFVSRIQDVESTQKYFPHLSVIDQKGGYVILERTDENYPFLGEP